MVRLWGLAVSFSTYGLIKKTVPLPSTASLTAEGVVLAPLAAGVRGGAAGGRHRDAARARRRARRVACALGGSGHRGAAAALRRVGAAHPADSALGTLRYIAPTLQFLLGVVVVRRGDAAAERWVGFGLVWLALVVFTVDLLRARPPVARPTCPPRCTEGGRMRPVPRILVRRPRPRLADGLSPTSSACRSTPSSRCGSGTAYVAALRDAGWETVEVEPADELPGRRSSSRTRWSSTATSR